MSKKTVFLMPIVFCCIIAVAIGLLLPSDNVMDVNAAGETVSCTYCSGTGLYNSEECPVCHGLGSYDASVAVETHTFSCDFTTFYSHSGYIVLNGVKQDSDSCQISVGDKIQIYTSHFDYAGTYLSGSSDSFDVYSSDFSIICQDIDYTEDGYMVPVGSVALKYTFLIVAPAVEKTYDVSFMLPDFTTVSKTCSVVDDALVESVWNDFIASNSAFTSMEYSSCSIYEGDTSIDASLPFTVDENNIYRFVLIPKSYTLTYDLNLPVEDLTYVFGEIDSLGSFDPLSYRLDSYVSCVTAGWSKPFNSYYDYSFFRSCLGVGALSPYDTLFELCPFKGWALTPDADADDVIIPASAFTKTPVYISSNDSTIGCNYLDNTDSPEQIYYYVLTSDTTLYAIYDWTTVSIEYDLNGGYFEGEYSDTFYYPCISLPTPKKDNYSFVEWVMNGDTFVASDLFGFGSVTLVASFTALGFNFCYVDSNEHKIYLDSSINSVPVHYDMAASITVEGFPFIPTIGQSDEVACYIWDAGVYWIVFYPFVVEIRKPVPVESLFYLSYYGQEWDEHDGVSTVYPALETYSYPFTLQCSHYDISIDCAYDVEALLVDPSVVPEKLRSYSDSWLSLWGESYQLKSDSSYGITSYFYGRCRLSNSLLINDTYSLSYLLGLAGFKDSLIFAAVTGDFVRQDRSTSDPAIMENNTSGGTSSGNLIFYCNDESTNAYLDAAKIDKTVISGNSSNSSSSNKTTSDFFNTIFEYLTKLLILVIIVFVMILVFKIVFLRTHF